MVLKKDDILNADDLKVDYVQVPEWGGEVAIRTLPGKERDAFEASMVKMTKQGPKQDLENLRARLLVQVIIDPDDNNLPIFTAADVKALGAKSGKALDRVWAAAQRLNGLSNEDVEAMVDSFGSDQSESATSE